jgi:shikimate dehydrogenase
LSRLAVIGHPVSHSRSPAMQTAALAELGLSEWRYEALDVDPGAFEETIARLPSDGFVGVNVTIPHKIAALALADQASPEAVAIGAANTLTFRQGIRADNTDGEGLLAALSSDPRGKSALVLGAGGAGRACVWALAQAGAEVAIWNRTAGRAWRLAEEVGGTAVHGTPGTHLPGDWDLIVNATSVGLRGAGKEAGLKALPLAADAIRAGQIVVDLVYVPGGTELGRVAKAQGAEVIDGLEVLVHQGAAALRIWTGLEPPIEVMRDAAEQFGDAEAPA